MTSTYNITVGQAGSGCGFKLYSPDGAIWSPINFDTAGIVGPGWKTMFDGLVDVGVASADGAGNDTGGFWGFSIFGSGLTMNFDQVSWIIYTQVNCAESGKTICIDSITDGKDNWDWMWYPPNIVYPTWGGPHCFIISSCCVGVRGNINRNGGDTPDILDLT
jgi:hypothetical protein